MMWWTWTPLRVLCRMTSKFVVSRNPHFDLVWALRAQSHLPGCLEESKGHKLKGNWLFVLYLSQTHSNKARLVSFATDLRILWCQPLSSVSTEAKPSAYPLSLCEFPQPQAIGGLHTLGALSFPDSWAQAPMPDGSPEYTSMRISSPPPLPPLRTERLSGPPDLFKVHPLHSVGHWHTLQ